MSIYIVIKMTATKIMVSRQYAEIELLDELLIHFCDKTPNWGGDEENI